MTPQPSNQNIFGSESQKIGYLYTAGGKKVRKNISHWNLMDIALVDYLDGFQYRDGRLQFFPTSEGYVRVSDLGGVYVYSYVYNYTDHLGNVRVSYAMDPQSPNGLKILEENHYYPFGLKHTNYNSDVLVHRGDMGALKIKDPDFPKPLVPILPYNYKYNGKEWQEELGLGMYDYGARNYDPAIGRWMNIDPLAEKMRRHSPYNYAYNNPITFVDPDGMKPESSQTASIYYDWDEGGYRTQEGELATADEALSPLNADYMPLTADIFINYIKEKYNVSDNQLGDFVGKLFEKAFITFGEENFEDEANFEGISDRSTLSRPDAYSDGYHLNLLKFRGYRYSKSVWWEVKARNKNVTLDKQIKGFIDKISSEFQYTATRTGAAFLCLVTTSNSNVSSEVYIYAKSKGVNIQHWQAQYKMVNGSILIDFGYKNSPITPPVFEFKKPVKL